MSARVSKRAAEPRNEVSRNRRGLATRETILRTAHRLLKDEGFEALSLDAVARAARLSRSSVYHQFHSRDGLLLELVADALRRLQGERLRGRSQASAIDRLLREAEAGFEADPELLRMFYLLIIDRSRSHPRLKRMLREAYRFRTRRIANALAAGGARLSDREREAVAVLLAAVLDGLYARSLIDLRGPRLKEAFDAAGRLFRARVYGHR